LLKPVRFYRIVEKYLGGGKLGNPENLGCSMGKPLPEPLSTQLEGTLRAGWAARHPKPRARALGLSLLLYGLRTQELRHAKYGDIDAGQLH
jgi:hypothetical protein